MDNPATNQANDDATDKQAPAAEKKETVREIHHHHYAERHRGFNFGRLAFGLIVIFIGVIWLAQNTGWINFNLNFDWWQLWPLIIIFIGLSLLSGRGAWSGLIGLLITLAVLAIAALLIFGNGHNTNVNTSATVSPIDIAKDPTITSAAVNIKAGAGQLDIGSTAEKLATGSLESNVANLLTSSEIKNNVQTITMTEQNGSWPVLGHNTNDLEVNLSNSTPLALSLDTGATDMNLNLKDIMAQTVNIKTGASSMKLEMGDKIAASTLNIEAGASSLNISLPKSLGAKLTVESGLSSKNLPDFNKIDDQNYQTANYPASDKKIDITLKIGVSSLDVIWR